MLKKTVSIVGLGYIGLPTALLLAREGVTVFGFDVDEKKVNSLKNGTLFFNEEGLSDLFEEVKVKKTFFPTRTLEPSDVFILAVPTPVTGGVSDLSYVFAALDTVKELVKDGDLIILESTVGPRDCVDRVYPIIDSWSVQCKFAHCTERAIPGNTLYEMINNDRIVGGRDEVATKESIELYSTFVRGELFPTDPTTAAVCKVMENTYRAVNIALANEFAKLAPVHGYDVWKVIELVNKHPRVNVHNPGPGVGGHCIPIDPYFFLDNSEKSTLIKTALQVNEGMPHYVYNEAVRLIQEHKVLNPTVCILGYAYKKNVDDVRETPAKEVAELFRNDYPVVITDPFAQSSEFLPIDDALRQANIVILLTDHDTYKQVDFSQYSNVKFILDTRACLSESDTKLGEIKLFTLGRNT